ncbi:MAG TPA: hypothetical protein VF166_01650 [Gemmatimonadaceae bacterium]
MCRPSAVVLIAAIGLGCRAGGDSPPPRAVVRVPTTRTLTGDGVIATRALVPLTLMLNIAPPGLGSQRFTASGDGECHHYAHPDAHGGARWEVRYRGESGPGIRMLVLRAAGSAGDAGDDVDVQLDAGDTMRLIREGASARASAHATHDLGSARVSTARVGSGARLTIDGVFSDGARIGGTIQCARVSSEP